jgi:hypothetical protein
MKLKNIFTQGKMNKDWDERLVPKGQYTHAENIQIRKSEGSDAGAVENVLGNKQLTNLSLGPNAESIGSLADESEDTIYFFVKSDTGSYVVEYNAVQDVASIVLKDTREESILNFSKDYLITGVDLVVDSDNGRRLLLWTDGLNPPRSINVERAKTYGENGFGQEEINVIKRPPMAPPTTSPKNNFETDENNLEDKFLEFATRFKYLDGEYSAISPFSAFQFKPKAFNYNYATNANESMVNSYKEVEITFNTGSKLVTDVEVLYKESGSNNIHLVETFNKKDKGWKHDQEASFTFSNNKIYRILPEKELFRLYDNVPRTAKAQTVIGNTLVYGNYVENYNLTDKDGERVNVDLKLTKSSLDFDRGLAKKSVKSIRDYEVGIAYQDIEGRSSTVLTSEGNTIYIPVTDCAKENKLRLAVNNKAPEWAKTYRVFVKQNKDGYDTVVATRFYQDGPYAWVKLGTGDADKFDEGDFLIVKADSSGPIKKHIETRILEIKTQERNFLEDPLDQKLELEDTGRNVLKQEAGTYFKLKTDGYRLNELDFDLWEWDTFASSYKGVLSGIAPVIDQPVFYGQGLDGLSSSGSYTMRDKNIRYLVEIQTTGAVDTFRWSDDDGVTYTENVAITGSAQTLSHGVSITFGAVTGHTEGDYWVVSAKTDRIKVGENIQSIEGYDKEFTFAVIKAGEGGVIEGGARISLQIAQEAKGGDPVFNGEWISSRRYENIEEWFYGDRIFEDFDKAPFNWTGYFFRRGKATKSSGNRNYFSQDPNGEMALIVKSAHPKQWKSGVLGPFDTEHVELHTNFEIFQSENNILFETKYPAVSSDIFYEIGRTYKVSSEGYHLGHDNNDLSQSEGEAALLSLPFFNCFAWGNGFESYKIKDIFNGKAMSIDSRPLGTIKDYRENHRIASLTYSGVYEQSTNYNALNEFNLSLANYKDLDDKFASIQRLLSRDTNIAVFQEDKVHQVLFNKNVLYNADGSSNVQQASDILGQEIAYAGEYGICLNPESLVTYETAIYFVDVRRGKVLRLTNNGLFPVSKYGMTDYFKDYFRANPNAKYVAGYDPHNDKVMISLGEKKTTKALEVSCGQTLFKYKQTEPFTYELNLDDVLGDIQFQYEVAGSVSIEVNDGISTTTLPSATGNGTFKVPKTDKIVKKVTVTVTPQGEAAYSILNLCPVPAVVVTPPVKPTQPKPTPIKPPQPVETGEYYAYEVRRCAACGSNQVYQPEPMTSPERLFSEFRNKVVKVGTSYYQIIDVDNYNRVSTKAKLHLTEGNYSGYFAGCSTALKCDDNNPIETFL